MNSKSLIRFMIGAALLGLISVVSLGSTPVSAQTDAERRGFFGEVLEATEGAITLQLKNEETVVIVSSDETTVNLGDGEDGGLAAVPVGSRFAALAEMNTDGEWVMKKGRTIPSRPTRQHRTYTVLERTGDTIIAKDADTGEEVIIELKFEPGEDLQGQEVTFIVRQLEGGRFEAFRAVGLRKIVARLQAHVEKKKQRAEQALDNAARDRNQRQVAVLKERLEGHVTKQVDRFTQVLLESPDESRVALEKALDNIKEGFKAALAALDKTGDEADEVLERRVVNAIVTEGGVNADEGLLTLRTRGDVDITVAVVESTEIFVGEEPGTIADIQDGDLVQVRFDRESGEAAAIRVREIADAKGRIESIDAESRTITIALADGGTLTINVADAQRVRVNGRVVPLARLLRDAVIRLKYNRRTLEVDEIEEEQHSEHTLTVEAIDEESGTVVARTDDGREITLRLDDATDVEDGNRRSGIRALKIGARIDAVVDRLSDRAVKVRQHAATERARERIAHGRIVGIRTDINGLTLRTHDGTEVIVIVDEDAQIIIDGEPGTIADIDGDAAVDIAFDPDTRVALKVVAARRLVQAKRANTRRLRAEDVVEEDEPVTGLTASGAIVKIDVDGGVFALFTERRRALELQVNSESQLFLNGEAVDSLGEFGRGVVVKVLFDRTDAGNIVDELHGHKRAAAREAVKESAQDTAADRAKLEQLRSSLALHARGRPSAGQPFRLQVTLNRQPIQGAEVTVNDRALGETNERGIVAFDVPEDAEALHIVASFRNQKVELKVRVIHPNDAAGTDTNTAGSRSSTSSSQ